MSKILKNQTGSIIAISDTGVSIPISPSTYTIPPQDYLLWTASDNIITEIGSGNIIVNDGSQDLGISDGTDLIKGFYPHKVTGGTDNTVIGNVGDALKVSGSFGISDNVHNQSTTFSASGSLKTSQETIIGNFRFDKNSMVDRFDIEEVGSSRYDIAPGGTGVSLISRVSNSYNSLFSKETFHYQAGRGLMSKQSIITGDSGIAGVIREWGLKRGENGTFLRLDGTTLSWIILRDGVETIIPSNTWDTPITHDGNGHLWYIQFLWSGVADLHLYYDGELVHTHNYIGTSTEFSIGTPDLKLYYYHGNTTNNTETYLKFGCASIVTEGGDTASRLEQHPNGTDLASLNKAILIGQTPTEEYDHVLLSKFNELLVYSRTNGEEQNKTLDALRETNKILKRLNYQLYKMTGIKGDNDGFI